ncbi:holo-ACP synthase [Anaerorhabdus sp.]|jgi:holo-[acyl-carrier protein] synthase|uniref:holo-ACP synthase n=1 Tax=Anaerorhabdus sp. TaxID=1872524 RepID=UPI002FCB0B77
MIVGIGCDICMIERVNLNIASKILTNNEMVEFNKLQANRQKEWLAGRFAAKEAIIKATGILIMSEIEIITSKEGKPICMIDGLKIHVSISHDGDYAMAQVVAENV